MDSELRKLQLFELELFKKFSKFCEENNITYYALGGTLLGAIRHKGFIPWDDDIDVGIPRKDYERFLKICEEKQVDFELHCFQNDESYYRYFARIEDPAMKVKRTNRAIEEISSAWMDIFPLDGMPNNRILREIWEKYILYRRGVYYLSCLDIAVNTNKKNRPFIERVVIKFGKIFPMQKILNTRKELKKLDKTLKRFPYEKSDYLVNAMGAYKFNEMFHKKYYGEGNWYEFEDTKIWGPEDYDMVCTQLYGDYMTPPSQDDRNHHGTEIIE